MSNFQQKIETITRKWWFFVIVVLLFFVPSYSSKPFDPRETSKLISAVLSNPLIYSVPILMPVFKVLPVLLMISLIIWDDKVTRIFDTYVAVTVLLFAVFQNSAITEEFGFAIMLGNVLVYLLVATVWFWEAVAKLNSFTPRRRPFWHYWVVPVAFLAFWFPLNPETLGPDFSLIQLSTNSAGLTTCMMLPVYLAVLTLYYPTVNPIVLRITALAGTITGLLNVMQWFISTSHPWIGILHLPLLTISVYALMLSFRKKQVPKT
jgi:hypothetical protein